MCEPEHDQAGLRKLTAQPEDPASRLAAVVDHRDPQPVQVEFQGRGRAPAGHVRAVVVADHAPDRRVASQLGQHGGGADVAGVQDQVGLAQLRRHRRRAALPAPRRVSVGDGHDPHQLILAGRARSFSAPGGRGGLPSC
jgi:hypothetical protein